MPDARSSIEVKAHRHGKALGAPARWCGERRGPADHGLNLLVERVRAGALDQLDRGHVTGAVELEADNGLALDAVATGFRRKPLVTPKVGRHQAAIIDVRVRSTMADAARRGGRGGWGG